MLKTGCHTNRLTISSGISSFPCLLDAKYMCLQLHCKWTTVKHLYTLSGYIYSKLLWNTIFLHDTESNNVVKCSLVFSCSSTFPREISGKTYGYSIICYQCASFKPFCFSQAYANVEELYFTLISTKAVFPPLISKSVINNYTESAQWKLTRIVRMEVMKS